MLTLLVWATISATPARLEVSRAQGAEACADKARVEALVAERLGVNPFEAAATTLIHIDITAADSGFEAKLMLGSATPRIIRSERADCSDLGPALAFALCVALDPMFLLRGPVDAGAPEMPSESPDAGLLEPAPPTASGEWQFAAGVHASVGAAPAINGGAHLNVGWYQPTWAIAFEGRADVPSAITVEGTPVSGQLLAATVLGCYRLGTISFCGLGAAGALRAWSTGLGSSTATTPWLGFGVRALWSALVSERIGVRVSVEAIAPVTRSIFRLGETDAWATGPLMGSLGLEGFIRVP